MKYTGSKSRIVNQTLTKNIVEKLFVHKTQVK